MIRFKTQNFAAISFFWILFTGVSCREKCTDANINLIKVKFFDAITLEEDTLAFDKVQGILATLVVNDSVLFDTSQTQTVFNLPISSMNERVDFLFERTSGTKLIQDTLSLTYTRTLEVIQPNCGISEIIRELNIFNHTFDSASVVTNALSNLNDEINIHVFIQD